MKKQDNSAENRIRELESKLSDVIFDLEETKLQLKEEKEKRQFYQLISDFTFGWELWFEADKKIKYCSPSCFDLTGFTSNQIIASHTISDLLVYETDEKKFDDFLLNSLNQMLINQSLEFRILTRTKQLRWCHMSIRGVYNTQGKYLGVRASIQDITRLKRAMGNIRELEVGKEFQNRTKLRLQSEISFKDRELVTFLLQLSQKNELINKTINLINNLNFNNSEKSNNQIHQLNQLLKKEVSQSFDWTLIENKLENLRPGFWSRLKTRHPLISVKDKKLCAYLLLGLSSKDISGLLNITPKSVEIARVRLRKKFNLSSSIRLVIYLEQI